MIKGYPAEQYYGKPADAIEEVDSKAAGESGKAEGVDGDSKDTIRKTGATPVSIKTRDYAMEATELRESFEKKIDFVTDLWKQIENPEVANLPLPEFRRRMLGLLSGLDNVIPNSASLISECEGVMKKIREVSISLELEDIKKQRDEGFSDDLRAKLESESIKFREQLRDRLSDPDFEFLHNCIAIVAEIFLKKTKIEPLREIPNQQNKVIAGLEFCKHLECLNFESEYGYDSGYSIATNENIKRLIEFLNRKISAGENIFDFIKIDSYDICFYLDRKDFDQIYINKANEQRGEVKKITIYGVHFNKTSIIFVAKGDEDRTDEDVERTKVHEQGHNLVGITTNLEGVDIHNTVYRKAFVAGLRSNGFIFKQLFEDGKIKDAKAVALDYMKSAIHKLNGEISADAKNIVRGYPKTFINYILNLIASLNNYVSESRDETSINIDEANAKNAFLQIVESEIGEIKDKSIDLVVRIVTYAHIARAHGLEDEFCSALVLMPDSEKYLKRVLSMKLDDEFDFELAKREINPDEIFSDAPDWMKAEARKHFGPNGVE